MAGSGAPAGAGDDPTDPQRGQEADAIAAEGQTAAGGGEGAGGAGNGEAAEQDGWVSEPDEGEGDDGWVDEEEEEVDLDDPDWEEEWMEEDEDEFDEEMAEGGFDESSDDAADVEAAQHRLAAETDGRHVHGQWTAYSLPTISHHFQSADALAVAEVPAPGGGLLLAAFDQEGVSVWRLPAAGSMQALGAGQPPAVRLGGFQVPKDAYSLAFSPDGRWLALGGDGGLLSLYSVDATAPPRPRVPPGSGPLESKRSLNYFYTPLVLPRQLRQLQEEQERAAGVQPAAQPQQGRGAGEGSGQGSAQGPAPGCGPGAAGYGPGSAHLDVLNLAAEVALTRTLGAGERDLLARVRPPAQGDMSGLVGPNDTLNRDFLRAVMAQDLHSAVGVGNAAHLIQAIEQGVGSTARLLARTAELGAPSSAATSAAPVQQLLADTSGKGKAPAHATAPQQDDNSSAAVQLRCLLALGMDAEQAKRTPISWDGMLNGVRFGLVAGKTRLLAADQSTRVYIFDLPASPAPSADAAGASGSRSGGSSGGVQAAHTGDLQAQDVLCCSLGEPSPHWAMRPVNFFGAKQHSLGARVSQQPPPEAGACFMTAALGPFPEPCNQAAASPDGRWIAVVGDMPAVYLADQAAGFAWRALPFDLAGSREHVEADLAAGAQYCSWNASSTLLAVSSDALHAVFVFEPAGGRMVMRVEGHARPCLCVGFALWDDRLLVYAEESKLVHLRRVPPLPEDGACCDQNTQDDLADARAGSQLLRMPITLAAGAGYRRRRVTGMVLTGQGDLLLTTRQGMLLRFLSSQPWGLERHAAWPPRFKAVARTLLLCAHRLHVAPMQGPGEQAVGLQDLPQPLLLSIVAAAAGQRTDWLGEAAGPAAAGAPQQQQAGAT